MADSDPNNTVDVLVARMRDGELSPSMVRSADRLFRRALPVATVACRVELRGVPPAQIEEAIQQTLEIAWRRLEDFEDARAPFEAWVRGIAKKVCANQRRRKRDLLCEDGVIEAKDPAHDVLRRLQQDERQRFVSAAIEAALEPDEQDVFNHRYLHNLDREQIADLVGLADANEVRVVLQRATRKLRAEILRRLEELGHGPSLLRSSSD